MSWNIFRPLRVLVAEDNPVNQQVAAGLLGFDAAAEGVNGCNLPRDLRKKPGAAGQRIADFLSRPAEPIVQATAGAAGNGRRNLAEIDAAGRNIACRFLASG